MSGDALGGGHSISEDVGAKKTGRIIDSCGIGYYTVCGDSVIMIIMMWIECGAKLFC
ncbi:hypothetical protein CCP2SC5_170026 [Azospirillaceae bacterium]